MPLILSTDSNPGRAQWAESSSVGLSGLVQTLGLDPDGSTPAPVVSFGPSRASGTITAASATAPTGESIVLGANTLTPTAGARTSGSDDYDATLTDAALINDIVEAINDPDNSFDPDLLAYRGTVANTITIETAQGGVEGNSLALSATGPALTVSGATLTGGGVPNPLSIVFQAPEEGVLLKQLFLYSAGFESADNNRLLQLTSITVDGGADRIVGQMSVPIVGSLTPSSSPEWNIPVPAGGVVTIIVENLSPTTALVVPTWTMTPTASPQPPERSGLGTETTLFITQGAVATATLTVGVAGVGDVLLFVGLNGRATPLTGALTQGTDDLNFDVSSGTATTIAASIRTAIENNSLLDAAGFIADTGEVGTTVTVTVNAGEFANTAFSITSVAPTITASAFTGAEDGVGTLVFPAAPADAILEQLFVFALSGEGAIELTGVLEINTITIDGGPNLIEGTLSGSMVSAAGEGNSPRLDIPISAGQVVSVGLENAGVDVGVSGAWITRPQ